VARAANSMPAVDQVNFNPFAYRQHGQRLERKWW